MTNAPELSEIQLGHMRHMRRLANHLPGEWGMMGSDWWDIGEGAHQYELAFMAYTLGIVQHHYTPAYREFCQDTIERLIGKMLLPDIWERWINASRGGKVVNPDQEKLFDGWIDPLKKHNIMYKGHLLQMSAMYEALYRTGRYVKADAFVFDFKATTWGNGRETYNYNLPKLAEIIYNEYVESNYEGCQCEPNRVYPMCNQHTVLGLIHFDQAFGTSYAADVAPKFKAAWLRKGYTDLESGSHMRMRWVQQDQIFPSAAPWADGWTGIFMHAWDREFIESLYPRERERHLPELLSGAIQAQVSDPMTGVPTAAKLGFGMFAALAAEVGDTETQAKLWDYADRNFETRWEDGSFYYPRCDDWDPDASGNSRGVDAHTGNALLPMARINPGSGLWNLYNQPWSKKVLVGPHFSEIDHDVAGVSSASYDEETGALHLGLLPGPRGGPLTFSVNGLDPLREYLVRVADEEMGTLRQGCGDGERGLEWQRQGTAHVRVEAAKPVTVTVAPRG